MVQKRIAVQASLAQIASAWLPQSVKWRSRRSRILRFLLIMVWSWGFSTTLLGTWQERLPTVLLFLSASMVFPSLTRCTLVKLCRGKDVGGGMRSKQCVYRALRSWRVCEAFPARGTCTSVGSWCSHTWNCTWSLRRPGAHQASNFPTYIRSDPIGLKAEMLCGVGCWRWNSIVRNSRSGFVPGPLEGRNAEDAKESLLTPVSLILLLWKTKNRTHDWHLRNNHKVTYLKTFIMSSTNI